jgi:hypothetical protein
METLRSQRELKRLASLSDASLDQLTCYLLFLESRRYADTNLRTIIEALNSSIRLLPRKAFRTSPFISIKDIKPQPLETNHLLHSDLASPS